MAFSAVSAMDFIATASDNVHAFDEELTDAATAAEETTTTAIGTPIGARAFSSGTSLLTGYIVPKQVWRHWSTRKRRDNWVTPQIPASVSIESFTPFHHPRLAYVQEYNYERTGARGLFEITHYAYANWGLAWVIGNPISPSLYAYLGAAAGASGARFAILARNTFWTAAVIGGFKHGGGDDDASFIVHYNDDGRYRLIHLPWTALTDFVFTKSPDDVKKMSWPKRAATSSATTLGDTTPLLATAAATPPPPGATPGAPLINEGFYGIDMKRFWPQFLNALEMAAWSDFGSRDLFAQMSNMPHWPVVQNYMEAHSRRFDWVPPLYAATSRLGKTSRPNYART